MTKAGVVPRRLRRSSAIIAVASAAYHQWTQRRDVARYPPPGVLVDVGGRRLHVEDHGGDGFPIVIETGAGTLARSWSEFLPRLQQLGHVITYDRPGYGWSDTASWRHSGVEVADDLAVALSALSVEQPCVVIGHSLGGLYARCFAVRHPDRTAGLVLVDSSHEDMLDRIQQTIGRGAIVAQAAMSIGMAAIPRGLFRAGIDTHILLATARMIMGGDTDEEVRLRSALYLTSAFRKASLAETLAIPATMAFLRRHRPLGALPLAVVTAAAPPAADRSLTARFRPAWIELQADLASLSSDSVHHTATSGGHFVYQDDPDTVEQAVKGVLARLP